MASAPRCARCSSFPASARPAPAGCSRRSRKAAIRSPCWTRSRRRRRSRPAWREFVALYRALRTSGSPWPAELAAVERWYRPLLERRHDDAAPRAADIAHLVRLAGGYASRERFLTELTLDPPAATSDEAGAPGKDDDYLILSTIHSAKGQEWSAVSVLRVVDGCIPSDMATGNAAEIEEERRLLYVAMTRARHHLHLLVPQRFYVTQQGASGDRHLYGSLSRFVPPALHDLFEHVARCGDASARRRGRRGVGDRCGRRRRTGPVALGLSRSTPAQEKAAVPDEPDTAAVDGPPSFRRRPDPVRVKPCRRRA